MRSSTILVLTLRSLAQETIKNLVLSGVGRLIVMDDKEVTEMDLGAGLLFREDEGAVGQKVSHCSKSSVVSFRCKVERREAYRTN
jgi:ubiquitin-like 1-activating enzyme E1 A